MTIDDLVKEMGLERGKHFQEVDVKSPVIDSHLYTSLGRRLFEIYEKNKISREDQREMERLIYLLTNFTIARREPKSLIQRILRRVNLL